MLPVLTAEVAAADREIVVKRIEVRGNKRIDASVLLSKISLKEDDIFSPERVQEEVKALYRTGFFEQVEVETEAVEGGLGLVFMVHERPILSEVLFKGNEKIITDRLKEKTAIKTRVFLDPQAIKSHVEKIRKIYEEEGYTQTEVTPVTERLNEGHAKLTFLIKEGPRAYIQVIRFLGNHAFSEKVLKKQIETSSYFFLTSWVTESGRLKEDLLEGDVERIREFYLNRGYLNIRVDRPKVTRIDQSRWFEVTFPLEEGMPFSISEVRHEGNGVLSTSQLIAATQSKKGAVFNREQIRNDIATMVNLYGEQGYLFANVVPQITPHAEEKTVDLLFQVSEQGPVRVREIAIVGNDRTRDKVIRREIRLNEGEKINTKLLKRSFQRLNNLNFFENIEITPQTVDSESVDLRVSVKEKSTGSLSLGGGYSSVDKLVATLDVSEGNLLGRGQLLRAKIDTGKLRKTYSLTFREPYLLDRPISGTADISNQIRSFNSYRERRIGGSLSLGKSYGEYVSSHWSYSRSTLDLYDLTSTAPDLIKAQAGKSLTSVLGFSIVRDTRDFIFDPREGSRHAVSIDYAGTLLGGDNDYYKVVVDSGRFFPLWRNHTLSLHSRIGVAKGIGGKALPAGERFFIGGINTVRGFEFGKAGPVTSQGQIFGGNKALFFNLEYLVPLVPEANLKGLLFYDYGQAFDDAESMKLSGLRRSAGMGLRWITPMGPLRLEWGRNLNPRSGERERLLDFSIGTLF